MVAPADSAPASRPAGRSGSWGVGDRYFPLDGNAGIDVLHYDVRDRYDFATRQISGTTRLRLRATRALTTFHLDLLLPVRWVNVGGVSARFTKPSRHEVRITPRRRLRAGQQVTVLVAYAGRPGTVSWRGERSWVAADHEVVTVGQPHMAPWWFAANDHPSDQATFDLRITTDADRQVVANGRQVRRRVHGDQATTHWRADEPMAPYLAFFAAGRFRIERDDVGGRHHVYAVSRAVPAPQRRSSWRLLRATPGTVDWLETQFGPYPFTTAGGVVTALNPGIALETQSRPVYPVVDEAAGRTLLVHELAHQWFGDAVSLHRWSDLWLNEGLATYAELRWTEMHGGMSADQQVARWYDEQALDPDFWSFRLADPGRHRLFHRALYVRGAMVVVALRERIGQSGLDAVLKEWVERYRGRAASTADFEALVEELAGDDLTDFFDAWLHAGRVPERTAANGL